MRKADYHYAIGGLRTRSDLVLPGLIPAPAGVADVVIQRGAVAPAADPPPAPRELMTVDVPGVVRMAMRAGQAITYDPAPDADMALVALYLGGTGFGALVHQRGQVVLHASAVRIGAQVVLFCGASGAGKSTLAAALVQAGHGHVADDFCAIRFDAAGQPWVAPDGRRHKLWDASVAGLNLADRRGAQVAARMDKFFVDPPAMTMDWAPVGALIALDQADGAPRLEPLRALDMITLIRANAYRPWLVGAMGQEGDYFEAATGIGRACPGYRLSRPMNFGMLAPTIALIEAAVGANVR
ncbi:hypothetical protein [Sphingomonas sp.]|uniref:hypothetical protein n=1 Tax=Sphingomonas sp. TaxID=28214 RepID=UPI001DF8B793|nr:hypothetical protein [Sphingomonas sp.]MBX9797087.1 hypothetical protein [Sphingomonas sp.]